MEKTKTTRVIAKKEPVKKEVTKKSEEIKFDPIEAVIQKYREFGWTVLLCPKESLNDLMAQKVDAHNKIKMHYIQIVTPTTIDHPDHTGIAKNTFIQNAFSNSAVPIFAHVVCNMKKTADGKAMIPTVTFEDVNLNARIIIGGNKKVVAKNKVTIDKVDQTV